LTTLAFDLLYKIWQPLLFRMDAELAHRVILAMLSALPNLEPDPDPAELRQSLWGLSFSNPLGVAAGLDKDARAVAAWQMLGFGFAELGTITPRPQPGNPAPRLWRLAEDRALINRLGFPGEGMEAVAKRIRALPRRHLKIRIGLNFGPNKDTPTDKVTEDYTALMWTLGPLADFVVINVSSPNTPGLRDWQGPQQLAALLAAIRSVQLPLDSPKSPPLLIKIGPDLDSAALDRICETAVEKKVDGIVATNTTIARAEVGISSALEGGLSGTPLRERARVVIRHVYQRTLGNIPIIGVGGISSAADAYGHIQAGASLVELYTGLIYEGPAVVKKIKIGLAQLLRRDGFKSLRDAVGTKAGRCNQLKELGTP
jgi:dihydroorotate dehydrogenase